MEPEYFFCALALLCIWLASKCFADDVPIPGAISLVLAVGAAVIAYDAYLPSSKAERAAEVAAREKRQAAARIPHVIREADGCKVYAFENGGRLHYFTRCGSERTSTESSWTEKSGKTTVTKTETINTEVTGDE